MDPRFCDDTFAREPMKTLSSAMPGLWLERIWQDVRQACRLFARNPGFTAIAVSSIALGTGANVAMFSAADALLLRPLPVVRPYELVTVGAKVRKILRTESAASYRDYVDIRDRSRSFDGLVAFTSRRMAFAVDRRTSPRLKVVTLVSGDFFRVLGVQPQLGRDFVPEQDRVPGRDAVAILSHAAWRGEFGGDPAALGRTIQIGGLEFTVIGVAPERFTGMNAYLPDTAYVPLAMWPRLTHASMPDPLTSRDVRLLTVKGRLKDGVTLQDARAELAVIGAALERAHPQTNASLTLTADSELAVRYQRNPLDAALVVMLTTLAMAVLCVACANVAGLLASRAPVRARELALRLAIGAGRARLVRQLLTESLAIAIAGVMGGLAVGYAGIVLLRQIDFPSDVVSVPLMQIDGRAMWFSFGLAVGTAVLFGLGPAIHTTRVDLAGALKSTGAPATGRLRLTGRHMLVAVQVALSLVLLTISLFTIQVFSRELTEGPGFRTSRLAKMTIDTAPARYGLAQAAQFFERALEKARRLPGVKSATVTSAMPLWIGDLASIVPEGYQLPEGVTSVRSGSNSVDESFFETMAVALLAGRAFRATDTANAPRVAIVNDTLANHYWPGQNAVGRRFRMDDAPGAWGEVVGVAKTGQYVYAGEPPHDMIYFPFRQVPATEMVLLAETAGSSADLLTPLRDVIWTMDGAVLVYDVQTVERFYAARTTTIAKVIMALIGGIGLMGLSLTMVALYGLVSYAVSRRTREIGIRMAVGAGHGRVVRMILRQGMMPAWAGLVVGLLLTAATARLLPALVPVNHRYDAATVLSAVPLLLGVTLLAAFVPARRAARVDPTVALRCE